MTTTESLDMIQVLYGIRQMYMQVWETAEKRFSMGVPVQELFDWCKHEYAEKDTFLERVIEDFKQVHSAQSDLQPTCNQLATDCISRQAVLDVLNKHSIMFGYHLPHEFYEVKEEIRGLPSAQPIIRCKDCKHSFLHDNGEKISRICGLTRMCGTTPDDWFCADAERREE